MSGVKRELKGHFSSLKFKNKKGLQISSFYLFIYFIRLPLDLYYERILNFLSSLGRYYNFFYCNFILIITGLFHIQNVSSIKLAVLFGIPGHMVFIPNILFLS